MDNAKRAVIVTGAAKGIGRAIVQRLAQNGWRVYAGVRSDADAAELRGDNIRPVIIDITEQATIDAAVASIRSELGDYKLGGLVNNAGIAVAGPLEFLPTSELRRQMEVNVIGQVAMIQATLELLRESKGRIVNIGSIAGRSAMPMTGPYSASKFALEAITDSLRVELMPWGVDVVIIEPGMIATPIWQTSLSAADKMLGGLSPKVMEYYGHVIDVARKRALGGDVKGLPPDEVAKVVEHVLTTAKPKTRYVVGRDAKMRTILQRLPDRLRDRLIWRLLR